MNAVVEKPILDMAKAQNRVVKFSIYRYDPDKDEKPYMQNLEVELLPTDKMLLDALMRIKQSNDDSLSFRRSCREGVCGSDAMNINGKNGLACITNMRDLKEPVVLRPLAGLPVVRDLIVDMTQFFNQYHSIKPFLINDTPPPEKERLQSPEEREELDGLYECILCACCSTSCPSFWWNPDKFVGPAGLLQARQSLEYDMVQAKLFLISGAASTEIALAAMEHKLIRYMTRRNASSGKVPVMCTHEELIDAVWGNGKADRSDLTHLIFQVRKKLPGNDSPRFLEAERGMGYRLRIAL